MPVITETGDDSDLERLDRAWSAPETFAFVPEKSSAPAGWVETAFDLVPSALRTEHYALLTSGSTGQPKLVIGNRLRSERLIAVINDAQDGGSVTETIVALPLHYCYAFVNQWLWAALPESATHTNTRFQPARCPPRCTAPCRAGNDLSGRRTSSPVAALFCRGDVPGDPPRQFRGRTVPARAARNGPRVLSRGEHLQQLRLCRGDAPLDDSPGRSGGRCVGRGPAAFWNRASRESSRAS